MASRRYDLHLHSTASDGLLGPRDVVAVAQDRGLSGIALTDHDTTAGLDEAHAAGAALGIEVIDGIELSCRAPEHGTIHLLGYGVDRRHPGLLELEQWHRGERLRRARSICEQLQAHTGLDLLDEVLEVAAGAPVGRPHVARVMLRHGLVADIEEAFGSRWLGVGGAGHVWPAPYRLQQGIDAIHAAGGAAVLAHPSRWRATAEMLPIALDAVRGGLDGVEVDHPHHDSDALEAWAGFAEQHGLVQTAGSDDHGDDAHGPRIGARTVSESTVSALLDRARRWRSRGA